MLASLKAADRSLLVAMRTRAHGRAPEAVAKAIGLTGEYGAIWFLGGLLGAALDEGDRAAWLVAGALAPAGICLNYAVKLAVRRPRPVLEGLPPLAGAPSSLSFPSAHTTSSFAAAVAMSRIEPSLCPLFFGFAVLIAVGRPYLGMHYPSDVLGGALLGSALGVLVPLP